MADDVKDQTKDAPVPSGVAADLTIAKQSKDLADAGALAEEQQIDETEPGGHYIVNGIHVNADGEPIKKYNKGS